MTLLEMAPFSVEVAIIYGNLISHSISPLSSNCSPSAADDRITIRWAESVLYGPDGAPSSDPRFTFTYDPRVHDRDDFWREEGAASYPQYPPTRPVEPYYGREPGSRIIMGLHAYLHKDSMKIFSYLLARH